MALRAQPRKLDEDGLWSYALRALGQRAHSAYELKQKLAARAQSPIVLNATLAKLREYGFTDDRKFSETLASARLRNQGFGRSRVLRELRAKRVSSSIAERAVETAFAGADEQDLIHQFLARKYRGKNLKQYLAEDKNLAGAYRRLRAAGFNGARVLAVLKQYTAKADDWDGIEGEE
ncbi:MAG: RecX family transcriptional regulator [Acidobacteriaceae bacterium]|nr:RecX family transcriptional regulator [Acidobacteriaceae bacterium]